MGRNSASQIHWSHSHDTVDKNTYTWYCQQHAKYDMSQGGDLTASFITLKSHLLTEHGNAEQ